MNRNDPPSYSPRSRDVSLYRRDGLILAVLGILFFSLSYALNNPYIALGLIGAFLAISIFRHIVRTRNRVKRERAFSQHENHVLQELQSPPAYEEVVLNAV